MAPINRETQLREHTRTLVSDIKKAETFLLSQPPASVMYGSHRPKPGDAVWEQTQAVGYALALMQVSVKTGAGPGVMSAAPAGFELGSKACDFMSAHTQGIHLAGLRVESKVSKDIKPENFIRLHHFRIREQALILNNLAPGQRAFGAGFPKEGGLSTLQELVHEASWMLASGHEKPLVMDPWWRGTFHALYGDAPNVVTRNVSFHSDASAIAEAVANGPVSTTGIDIRGWSASMQREMREGLATTLSGPARPVVFCGGRGGLSDEASGVLTMAAERLSKAGVGMRVGQGGALANAVRRGAAKPVDAYLDAGDLGSDGLNVRYRFTMKPAQQEVLMYDMGALVLSWPGDADTMAALFATITEVRHNKRAAVPIVITGDLDAARKAWDIVADSRNARLSGNTDASKDAFYGVVFSNDPAVIAETVAQRSV